MTKLGLLVCGRCGRPGKVAPAHPSVDPNLPLGYCEVCTPVPKLHYPNLAAEAIENVQKPPKARELVPLMRDHDFMDMDKERKAQARARRIVRKVYQPGASKAIPTEAEQAEAAETLSLWWKK